VIFIVIASLVYPGGSLLDKNSIGFGWSKNFLSNLFAAKAINGAENAGRIWAIGLMESWFCILDDLRRLFAVARVSFVEMT